MDVKVGNVREEGSGRKRAMTRAVEDMMRCDDAFPTRALPILRFYLPRVGPVEQGR